ELVSDMEIANQVFWCRFTAGRALAAPGESDRLPRSPSRRKARRPGNVREALPTLLPGPDRWVPGRCRGEVANSRVGHARNGCEFRTYSDGASSPPSPVCVANSRTSAPPGSPAHGQDIVPRSRPLGKTPGRLIKVRLPMTAGWSG